MTKYEKRTITEEKDIPISECCDFCGTEVRTEDQIRYGESGTKLEFHYNYYDGDHEHLVTCQETDCIIKALKEIVRAIDSDIRKISENSKQ